MADTFGWQRAFRVAKVYLDEKRFVDGHFVETVADNRGYRFKVFQNEVEAMTWLFA
jgi:hypothetical protein